MTFEQKTPWSYGFAAEANDVPAVFGAIAKAIAGVRGA